MRDPTLHDLLHAFATETAALLADERAGGAEIPFEVVDAAEGRQGSPPLYCYRALTAEFIEQRMGLLSGLVSYAPAARALGRHSRASAYLSMRGVARIPEDDRERADAVLLSFLGQVFADRVEFELDAVRFRSAYEQLEKVLLAGQAIATIIVPLLGLELEERTWKLELAEGLSLVRGDRLQDAPPEAAWDEHDEPHVLAVFTATQEDSQSLPWAAARRRFSLLLSATRLFERGSYGLGPLAWGRIDFGVWRPAAVGAGGRPTPDRTLLAAGHEDEFRGFCNLLARRLPALRKGAFGTPELDWALTRFELGGERASELQALTDYLLALRALLEPEGPASSRLAQRLALICARPEDRTRLAERTAIAIAFERSVLSGMAEDDDYAHELVEEMSEYLRALLRDALCGHLQPDLVGVAEAVLAEELASVTA